MRRTDRQISEVEAMGILERGEYGVMSTVSPAGEAYGVPLNYCVVNGAVYFHCALEGAKIVNLEHHPRVSFCVVGRTEVLPRQFSTRYESCIVQGTASECFEAEKQKGLEGLIRKYSQGFVEEGLQYIQKLNDRTRVFKIVIETVTGKARV